MNPLFEAAHEFQLFVESRKWPFCFIGGLAVLHWGAVRMTVDVDASVYVGYGDEQRYIDALLGEFSSRISDAREFAMANRVLLLLAANRISVDVVLAALEYEQKMIRRSSLFEFAPGCRLRTCSAEDLIVLKAFADRPVDWADVESILARQVGKLDSAYVLENLAPLAEARGAPEIVTKVIQFMDGLE